MQLSRFINTFGEHLRGRYGTRVRKLSIDAGATCPNRDGTLGVGGCSFCDNRAFAPTRREAGDVAAQVAAQKACMGRITGARLFLAYFQAYTNTYGDPDQLESQWREALEDPEVVGISIATRPDCLPDAMLDRIAALAALNRELWLEIGLQSAHDATLARVNRGHGFAAYADAVGRARARGIPVCTHLIVGLPGETMSHCRETLARVVDLGVEGLKLHPLHVVRHTRLANEFNRGEYAPWGLNDYVAVACDLIERTPETVIFHRVSGNAPRDHLLGPDWCASGAAANSAIAAELGRRGSRQGAALGRLPRSANRAVLRRALATLDD